MLGIFRKKILGVALSLAAVAASLIAALPAFAAAPYGDMNLSTPNTNLANGANFTVTLNANVGTNQTRAWGANINFNPAQLQVVGGVTEGTFLSGWAATHSASSASAVAATIDNVGGHVNNMAYYLQGGTGGPTGAGTLASITFHAISTDTASVITVSSNLFTDLAGADITPLTTENLNIAIGNVPAPDLVVTLASATADPVDPTKYSVSFSIKNQGNAAAVASQTLIDVDGVHTTGGSPAYLDCGALAAGAIEPFTITSSEMYNVFGAISGTSDTITLTADYNNQVIESNETNNTASFSYTYYPPSAGQGVGVDGGLQGGQLSFTINNSVTIPDLAIVGTHTNTLPLNVKSNQPWLAQVVSDIADGKMTKYNGSVYSPLTKLHNPLHVISSASAVDRIDSAMPAPNMAPINVSLTNVAADLARGVPEAQALDGISGETRTITFSQQTQGNDTALPTGFTYHLVSTFNVTTVAW